MDSGDKEKTLKDALKQKRIRKVAESRRAPSKRLRDRAAKVKEIK
jgi:hypothetical protein